MVFQHRLVSAFLFLVLIFPCASIAQQKTTKTKDIEKKVEEAPVKELRRLDFRLDGSECASCLGRIRKRMAAHKGVIKAAVLIKKPYGAAAIYDGGVTNAVEIQKAALKDEKVKVKILESQDQKIDKMPFILVPRINQFQKK